MVRNLWVNSLDQKIDKIHFHRLISRLKLEFNFRIESLLINFVTSDYLLKINKKFLKHNFFTDIITFNYSKKRLLFDAELYISLQEAERNAKKYHVTLEQELLRLVIHGILHLLGYDDKNPQNQVVMKEMENQLVKKCLFLIR